MRRGSPGGRLCASWESSRKSGSSSPNGLTIPSERSDDPSCPFCETDLPLQQLVQEAQLAANVMEAYLHQRIVMAFEPLVGLPVHTFGLVSVAIQNASLPAQALAQLVGLGGCPVACAFFLRGIAQPTTLAASEVPARRVEHRHPFAAPGAGEPMALAAQMAG